MGGRFSIGAMKQDTIIISARGYSTKYICFNDSVSRAVYDVQILMQKLTVNLREIEIRPERKIEEIESDINRMKEFDQKDFMVSGFAALQSPLTFFYQKYNRMEKSKRRVAELLIEDKKREVLKELLKMYVHGKLIELDETEFDDFINYCNIDLEFLKNCSQYEFIVFIKKKYGDYNLERRKKK